MDANRTRGNVYVKEFPITRWLSMSTVPRVDLRQLIDLADQIREPCPALTEARPPLASGQLHQQIGQGAELALWGRAT